MDDLQSHAQDAAAHPLEATGWLSLADHFEDGGQPGDILKAAALRLHAASLMDAAKQHQRRWTVNSMGPEPWQYRREPLTHGVAVHFWRSKTGPIHYPIAVMTHEVVPGVTIHTPLTHEEAGKVIHDHVQEAQDRPTRLARTTIIASGPNAGNEPGVNMWTGNESKAPRKPPILAEHVPESHWADGILHQAVYPGTSNINPKTTGAAWHERGAVHADMERRAGRPVSQEDVQRHIAVIRALIGTEAGRKFLGPALERYRSEAGQLPALLPADSILRGSSVGSRPVGPRASHLQTIVSPLVGVANQLLARQGNAQVLKAAPEPASAVPEHEDATEQEWEHTPTIPPAHDLPPIKVAGARETERVKKGIVAENAAETKKPGWEHLPIPVVSSVPGETGPTGHRWNDIRKLMQAGHDRQTIIEHLRRTYYLTHKNAADTLRRFARAEDVAGKMRKAEPVAPVEEPLRLARPGVYAPLLPSHLSGRVGPSDEDVAGKKVKSDSTPIDPHIAGTSLAYHLRQIAQDFGDRSNPAEIAGTESAMENAKIAALAERALAGQYGFTGFPGVNRVNGKAKDVFTELGTRLKMARIDGATHPLANAYNWGSMTDKLQRDKWIEKQMAQIGAAHRKEGETNSVLYDRMHRAMRDQTNWGNSLWAKMTAAFRADKIAHIRFDTKAKRTVASFLDSIHRVADRHLDREYLKAVSKGADRNDWRDVVEHTVAHKPGSTFAKATKHLKFQRSENYTFAGITNRE